MIYIKGFNICTKLLKVYVSDTVLIVVMVVVVDLKFKGKILIGKVFKLQLFEMYGRKCKVKKDIIEDFIDGFAEEEVDVLFGFIECIFIEKSKIDVLIFCVL